MEELLQLILKTYGIAGLVMLSPMVAVVFLWRHSVAVQKNLSEQLNSVNEKRIEDAKAVSEKLIALVGEQGALNKETNMALERVGDMLTLLPTMKR